MLAVCFTLRYYSSPVRYRSSNEMAKEQTHRSDSNQGAEYIAIFLTLFSGFLGHKFIVVSTSIWIRPVKQTQFFVKQVNGYGPGNVAHQMLLVQFNYMKFIVETSPLFYFQGLHRLWISYSTWILRLSFTVASPIPFCSRLPCVAPCS